MAFGKSWTMNTKASLKEYKRQRQVAKSIKMGQPSVGFMWFDSPILWKSISSHRQIRLRQPDFGGLHPDQGKVFREYPRKVWSNSKHTLLCLCRYKRTIKQSIVSCVASSLILYRNDTNAKSIYSYETLLTCRFTDSLSYGNKYVSVHPNTHFDV